MDLITVYANTCQLEVPTLCCLTVKMWVSVTMHSPLPQRHLVDFCQAFPAGLYQDFLSFANWRSAGRWWSWRKHFLSASPCFHHSINTTAAPSDTPHPQPRLGDFSALPSAQQHKGQICNAGVQRSIHFSSLKVSLTFLKVWLASSPFPASYEDCHTQFPDSGAWLCSIRLHHQHSVQA